MREILFRAKRIDNDEWTYGFYGEVFNLRGEVLPAIRQKNDYWRAIIPKSLSQYTGLKDRNGKKIFEGDIVEFKDKNYSKSLNYRRIVTFGNGCFLLKNIKTGVHTNFNMYQCEYCVIGNIHDNPELLEDNKNE